MWYLIVLFWCWARRGLNVVRSVVGYLGIWCWCFDSWSSGVASCVIYKTTSSVKWTSDARA